MRVCCYQGVNKGAIKFYIMFVELANKGSKGYCGDHSSDVSCLKSSQAFTCLPAGVSWRDMLTLLAAVCPRQLVLTTVSSGTLSFVLCDSPIKISLELKSQYVYN